MDDLVQWLGKQLDKDELIARHAPPGPWIGTDSDDVGAWSVYDPEWLIASATVYTHDKPMGGKRGPGYIDASATTAHIAAHDPARVLREIDAKRRLLDRHAPHSMGSCRTCEAPHWGVQVCNHCERRWPCPDILDLASVYADRPGYREAWRP